MRRRYAFEAEELSPEVKAQLEKVEEVVDEKCDSPEACNKMIEKINGEVEKFNGALTDMKNAAQDCKDGKCDKAEMASKISPKMAELKEVAKSIGVASEGETLTEAELKDAKTYLEGAKEIVESKLDEVGDKKDESKADKKDEECDGEDCEEVSEEEAAESFVSVMGALESCTYDSYDAAMVACEAAIAESFIAMEGYNWDKRKEFKVKIRECRTAVKAAKAAAKAGNVAEAKAKMADAIKNLEEYRDGFKEACKAEQGIGDAILGYFAYGLRGFGQILLTLIPTLGLGAFAVTVKQTIEEVVDVIQIIQKLVKGEKLNASDFNMYTKAIEHDMELMLSHYKTVARKIDAKAIAAAQKSGGEEKAEESFGFDGFIQACESAIIAASDTKGGDSAPYLFG